MKIANELRLKFIDWVSGLKIYTVLQELEQQQYMQREAVDNIRSQRLDTLFAIAKQSAPYYADFNDYRDLPELTKKTISKNPSQFISSSYKDKLIKKSTSGTTGTPFAYQSSVNAQSHLWAGLLLSWECTGYQFGDSVSFIAGSAIIKKSFKHAVFYKLMNIDLYPATVLTDDVIDRYIQTIKQKKTTLIYGYAMAINIMADYINRKGIKPGTALKGVVCTSEMLTQNMRENIEKAFGVKVFNQYGVNEAGISAFECGLHNLHLISSRCVYEINHDNILISTDLTNDASIFMKYNTGDIVEFSDETCTCGRNFPIIKNIIGRSDDVITDMKGRKIHCSYFTFLFKKDKSVRQYQVFFDDTSLKLILMVDNRFSENKYNYYLDLLKSNFDFEEYEIKINTQFFTSSNLKHTFIVDKRKYKQAVY